MDLHLDAVGGLRSRPTTTLPVKSPCSPEADCCHGLQTTDKTWLSLLFSQNQTRGLTGKCGFHPLPSRLRARHRRALRDSSRGRGGSGLHAERKADEFRLPSNITATLQDCHTLCLPAGFGGCSNGPTEGVYVKQFASRDMTDANRASCPPK